MLKLLLPISRECPTCKATNKTFGHPAEAVKNGESDFKKCLYLKCDCGQIWLEFEDKTTALFNS